MQNVIIAVLTIAYILTAYVGPVAAIGYAGYWAWSYGASEDGGVAGAVGVFVLTAIVLLVVLMVLKRGLKSLMRKIDLGEDAPQE
ncbi:MAG: hypothetical protein HKM96_13320 [Boseongicola sp.]|nr:hypothetical protein [Silicimonas sp.]NNF92364.1 hypothetical protein [Boseongicola sp.]RZW06378.1 MAG: hypothetical protein EX266_07695 [Paracoccaceae bacterium]NND43247.1 hypothetical protein [Silicimonas sp.]NNL36246.1 hypothetical protein [Silicimonas sp.]